MKIDTQPREDHQVVMHVEIDSEQLESAKRRAARRISERKSIPGFRPGKAPYDVVLRTYGEGVIVEDAVDILLDEVYPKALAEAKIEPAAPGTLEKVENIETTPTFSFLIPLVPVVDLGNYFAVRLPYSWVEPGRSELDAALEDLRQMYAKTETVNRPIEPGDFVLVDVKGKENQIGNEDPLILDRDSFPVFIREDGKPDEWPFTGFSKTLIGLNVGEEKIITHKFPKGYADEKLKGRTFSFNVSIKMVRGTSLPELNDEFAKNAGPFTNLAALQDAMKANISAQSKADYDDKYFSELVEKIKEQATIKYAPQTLDHELEHVIEDIKSRLTSQNMDLAAYLKTRDMDEPKFIAEEARPVAIKRLERSLIMEEIARLEKIELDKNLLDKSFQQTWGELQTDQTFQKSMRGKTQPSRQLMNAVARESANRAYVQQTLERMKMIATGTSSVLDSGKSGKHPESKVVSKEKLKGKNKQSA